MEYFNPPDRNNAGRTKARLIAAMCLSAILMLVLFGISIHQSVLISGLQTQHEDFASNTTGEMKTEQILRQRLQNATNNLTMEVSKQLRRMESNINVVANVSNEISDEVKGLAKFAPYQEAPNSGEDVFSVKANQSILLKEDMIMNSTWHFTHTEKEDSKALLLIPTTGYD